MRFLVTFIIAILLLLLVLAVGSQNTEVVGVNFLIVKLDLSVAMILSIGMLVGALFVLCLFAVWLVKMKVKLRQSQRLVNQMTSKER